MIYITSTSAFISLLIVMIMNTETLEGNDDHVSIHDFQNRTKNSFIQS